MRFRARMRRPHAKPAALADRKKLCAFGVFCMLTWSACGGAGLFRQYEYEEEMYLALDGTATMYVNSSIAALNALRGTSFDTNPTVPVDRERVRAYFSGPNTHVTWVRSSRRNGRRFVHVRLEVDDVRRLAGAAPFSWSSFQFERAGNVFEFRQALGLPGGKAAGHVNWTGKELVAFRLHLPSKIEEHNTLPENHKRGNILVWEQSLGDRLRGVPLTLNATMQTQSILYRTMWLFAGTFVAVALTFGAVLWWILRRGAASGAEADPGVRSGPTHGSAPTVN